MAATIPTNGMGLDAGLDITGGNLTFKTADKGVHLGVTSATAANLLDDYEEGTFTPVLSDAASGGNTASIGLKSGVYIKVGNLVTVMVNMFNITKSGMTSSNVLNFQGLPFTVANSFYSHVVGSCEVDSIDFTGYVTISVYNNSTSVQFRNNSDSTNDAGLLVSAITTAADSDINFTVTYKTA
jgi:hypothetical protein|tara:strand:- start:313 stop:861 length:549 start_codon:yes stop_codon:yes gene_type:complete